MILPSESLGVVAYAASDLRVEPIPHTARVQVRSILAEADTPPLGSKGSCVVERERVHVNGGDDPPQPGNHASACRVTMTAGLPKAFDVEFELSRKGALQQCATRSPTMELK